MAGRGGRSTSSFTKEQLQALGVGKETPSSVSTPVPPLFPPLVTKPSPLDNTRERQYKLLWKEDFISFLKDSPYFVISRVSRKKTDSGEETEIKSKPKPEFLWHVMPPELRPNFKRHKTDTAPSLVKKKKVESIDEKLKQLEEKENVPSTGIKIKTEKPDESDEDKDPEEDEEGGLEEDDEMDFENDYGNNYFDNGEAFNEEDDNLDDGPVY